MILFCLSNKALYSLQFALLILINNYCCCIFFCISYICCDFRCLLFIKSFSNVCRIILTNSFYLLFLSSSFNDRNLDRAIYFFWLSSDSWKETSIILFWRYIFSILSYKHKIMSQGTLIFFPFLSFSL